MDIQSILGYSQGSPFAGNPYLDIQSNNITMEDTAIPLLLQPMKKGKKKGKAVLAKPFSKNPYLFPSADSVREIPIMQKAGSFNPYGDPRDIARQNISRSDETKLFNIPVHPISSDRQVIKEAGEAKKIINTKELARRKKAISQSNSNNSFATSAAGDKLRLFPDDPNSIIDEYLNPLKMVGDMADNIGHTFTNPNAGTGEKVLSLATPLTMGAIGSLGAKTTGQFINNLFNPFAGVTSSVDDIGKGFKSEIDWSKWNKEIPNNSPLMKEYNKIEQYSKSNGTWMKNPDGSTFEGIPEQFVQQNSKNFKKAFPNGHLSAYRGSQAFEPTLTKSLRGNSKDQILFGATNKKIAKSYASNSGYNLDHLFKDIGKEPEFFHPDKNVASIYTGYIKDVNPGIYEYAVRKDLPTLIGDAAGDSWRNVESNKVLEWLKNEGRYYRVSDTDIAEKINRVSTDNMANYMIKNKVPIGIAKRTKDSYGEYADPGDILMTNSKVAKPKSLRYNNGMFDMSNPNIYKSLIPVGVTGTILSNKQDGGEIDSLLWEDYDEEQQPQEEEEVVQIDNYKSIQQQAKELKSKQMEVERRLMKRQSFDDFVDFIDDPSESSNYTSRSENYQNNSSYKFKNPYITDINLPSAQVVTGDKEQRASYAMRYLMAKGLTKEAAAGIIGNAGQESSMFHPKVLSGERLGDKNTSYGAFQWHGPRMIKALNWMKQNNKNINSIDTHLEYALEEAIQMGIMNLVNSAKSPEQAANIWRDKFEIPAVKDLNRANFARQIYNKF